MGLYRTGGIYCTQCEAEGFRRITYFPDRPDVLAPSTRSPSSPTRHANPLMLSNGNFLGAGDYGDGRRFAAWFDPHPKPSYLFALVAGDLGVVEDTFTTMSEPRGGAEDLCRARQGAARSLCHGRAEALDEVGRGERSAANTISTSS